MGRLRIPISDDRAIRRGRDVAKACGEIGAKIAVAAGAIAHDPDGYGVETSTGTDRTRVNVWAKGAKAIAKEKGGSPPLQQAAMRAK